jgi:hypothetical protein
VIASGFHLPWWMEWIIYAIVYAPYWVPAMVGGIALAVWLRGRK